MVGEAKGRPTRNSYHISPNRREEKMKRIATKYPGVFYIEGKGARGPEKIFYILYRRDGKLVEEKAGRQFVDDMTPAKAAGMRARRIEGREMPNTERRAALKAAAAAESNKQTVSRLWESYEASDLGLKSRASDHSRYTRYIKPHLGDKEPREITRLDVERLKRVALAGKSPQTVKLTLSLLRRLLRYGTKREGIPGPAFTFDEFMPTVNNEVIETLTDSQMKKLLTVLKETDDIQIGHMMLLALYTGMRKSELIKLRWADVDLDSGFIRLRDTKGKRDMTIPLNRSARDILEGHPRQGEHVFTHRGGRPFKEIRKRVQKLREAADLPGDFRPLHGLRHVFATTLANSGEVDLYVLQRLLTHKDAKTTSRYAHLLDRRLQDASAVIDKVINGE